MTIDADNGILLKHETPFQETALDEVASCLRYHGRPKSLEDMGKAIIIRSKMEKGYPYRRANVREYEKDPNILYELATSPIKKKFFRLTGGKKGCPPNPS